MVSENGACRGGLFQTEKPDYVFLAAAKVGGIHANNTYPADFIYLNLMIQSNVIKHHIGILSENFQHQLGLVVEGQQMVAEKVDRLETRMERLEARMERLEVKVDALEVKVDAVAADLSAHRADTEAHHGVYRLKKD